MSESDTPVNATVNFADDPDPERRSVREWLSDLATSLTPDPRGRASQSKGFVGNVGEGVTSESADEEAIEDYRDLFVFNPIIRESVRTYSDEVLEPGYKIVADNEETVNELEDWAEECAIVGGQLDKDLLPLLDNLVTDRLLTGTGVIEHVGTDSKPPAEELAALQLLRIETFEIYKRPGTNILVRPDDDFEGAEDYPRMPNGDLAAFVQFDDGLDEFHEDTEKPFPVTDISLFVRDAMAGSVRGASTIKPVKETAENMDQKQDDIAQAVRTMAYPHRYVKFGDKEYVWPQEEIVPYMEEYEPGNFEPGQSSGGPVDVTIEQFSGEAPTEVQELIDADVDAIATAMPVPKYELGGYAENINQFVSRSQENKQNLQIRSERRRLEAEFTPIFKEKAEQLGLDTSGLKLKIEHEEGQDMGAHRPHQQSEVQ